MEGNAIFRNRIKYLIPPEEKPKVVALLNLARALRLEHYEECEALIRKARNSGTSEKEISKAIVSAIRGARKNRHIWVDASGKTRPRFY